MSTTTPAPKTMSSRLLTMKFMQRAAASTPTSSSPATPEQPSPKRRKIEREGESTPTKFNVDALVDQRAIQAAIASEEAKRLAALERQADESGDTRWVLNFEHQDRQATGVRGERLLRVVETGWGGIDTYQSGNGYLVEEEEDEEEEDEDSAPVIVGRRSFGKFNKVVEKKQQDESISDQSSEEESDQSNDDSDADSDDPTSQLIKAERDAATSRIKAERKAARKQERKAASNFARERVKKEVNLNGLSSLSGRQDSGSNIKCYGCGGPHRRHECPNEQGGPREGKRRFEGDHNNNRQKSRRSK